MIPRTPPLWPCAKLPKLFMLVIRRNLANKFGNKEKVHSMFPSLTLCTNCLMYSLIIRNLANKFEPSIQAFYLHADNFDRICLVYFSHIYLFYLHADNSLYGQHDHLPQSKHIVDVELELSRIPASIRPQVKTWYDRHFPHAESGISNKEPASLRAQVEEKKIELFHLLSQLKYSGENSNLEDERILRQLPPYRELKHLVNGYG